jgi:DNA-directed RNA polymerase I, II, and III subunit RPABC2
MSSYFDNQYGGDDDNDNISVASSTSSSSKDEEEIQLEDNDVDGFEEYIDVDEDEDLNEDVDEDEDLNEDEDDDDEMEGGDPEDMESGELDEEADASKKKSKRTKKIPSKTIYKKPIINDEDVDDDEDDDEDGELYLQKFDNSINDNYILNFHPECALQNYDEILSMIVVIRDKNGIIIDDLHKTIPYLTKYERARILGQRAKQINSGSSPFVKVPENVIDGYIIAELELKEKKIPFIIRRPLPNGGSEYWSIKDLEDILF